MGQGSEVMRDGAITIGGVPLRATSVTISGPTDPPDAGGRLAEAKARTEIRAVRAAHGYVGRNHPCPCGSGRKFKRCHYRGGR